MTMFHGWKKRSMAALAASVALVDTSGASASLVKPNGSPPLVMPNTLLVEIRNVSCTVTGTNGLCAPDQVKFIDDNLPIFNPNGTSRFVGIKVPDNITCDRVRALEY